MDQPLPRHSARRRSPAPRAQDAVEPAFGVGKRFLDRSELNGRELIHLHPGDIHYSAAPAAIYTLLGSCVAVCLWDPVARVGGITHYVLPDTFSPREFSTRFGRIAVSVLVEQLAGLGAGIPRLRAKVFGGANVVSSMPARGSVAEKNVALARGLLSTLEIPVLNEDTGGRQGRVLVFCTDNGVALVRKV